MNTFILDDSEKEYIIPTEYKKHIEKFDVEPNIIGMFWSDIDKVREGIINAIKTNLPYDEYKMLSKEEQIDFDSGDLLF